MPSRSSASAATRTRSDARRLAGERASAVQESAADAIASIQNSLAIWTAVQNTWYGLSLASVLRSRQSASPSPRRDGRYHMAHGGDGMLGAYTTFVVQEVIRTRNPALSTIRWRLRFRSPSWSPARSHPDRARIIRFLYGRRWKRCSPLGAVATCSRGSDRLRADQQGRPATVMDERGIRARPDHHHL